MLTMFFSIAMYELIVPMSIVWRDSTFESNIESIIGSWVVLARMQKLPSRSIDRIETISTLIENQSGIASCH
jgi:hypothetical protein